jgi:hypothetical protein
LPTAEINAFTVLTYVADIPNTSHLVDHYLPLQIFSSDSVNTGVGVYWMFYTGGNFEEAAVPSGMPALPEGKHIEGLRHVF